MGNYRSVSAMAKDIDLLTKNAKNYNEPGSQVFKVSCPSIHLFLCQSVSVSIRLPYKTVFFSRMQTPSKSYLRRRRRTWTTRSPPSPAYASGKQGKGIASLEVTQTLPKSPLLSPSLPASPPVCWSSSLSVLSPTAGRNRRSTQGDRLSAITMALQYESDEEGILSGTSLGCLEMIEPVAVVDSSMSCVECSPWPSEGPTDMDYFKKGLKTNLFRKAFC